MVLYLRPWLKHSTRPAASMPSEMCMRLHSPARKRADLDLVQEERAQLLSQVAGLEAELATINEEIAQFDRNDPETVKALGRSAVMHGRC